MIALIKNGECIAIVDSTDGHDLTGVTVIDAPENPAEWRYQAGQWQPRPLTDAEKDEQELAVDSRWNAVKSANPAQIDAWLAAHVTTLADARAVLKTLLLAVRKLERSKR